MTYGVLIILEPPENTWPEGWPRSPRRPDLLFDSWVARLKAWETGIEDEVYPFGARAVLAFTPMQQPDIAQTNIWVDDVGDNLQDAMNEATKLVQEICQNGHSIRSVQILDWMYRSQS